jgi:hypothetical protein
MMLRLKMATRQIIDFPAKSKSTSSSNGGGQPPMDLTDRVSRIETTLDTVKADLAELKTDVAIIKSNYATHADIAKLETKIEASKNSIIMWVVGAIFLAQLLPMIKDWASTSKNPSPIIASPQALPSSAKP